MSLNVNCPKCGSCHVQLSSERRGHSILWLILLGWLYVVWVLVKWIIGFYVLILFDWWMAIIQAILKKPHKWACMYWFSTLRRTYYCHNCGHNFRA